MGQSVVIDLGEVREAPEPAAHTLAPPRRRTVGLIATVALVGALGGAVPWPAPVRPVVIATARADVTMLVRDHYYVVSSAVAPTVAVGPAVRVGTLTAYRVPTGRPTLRIPLRVPGVVVGIEPVGDVLLVSSRNEVDSGLTTTAVDAATGTARWQLTAGLMWVTTSGRSVIVVDGDEAGGERIWRAVDPSTGRTRWSHLLGSDVTWYLPRSDQPVKTLVAVKRSGRTEVRDAETGAVIIATDLVIPETGPGSVPPIWMSNDLLLITAETGITAYGLDRLDRRWQNEVRVPDGSVDPSCGDVICFGEPNLGTWVIDPATGRVRFASDQWASWTRAGGYLFGVRIDRPSVDASYVVLDATTGRVNGSFGRWQPSFESRPDGRIIGLRRDLSRSQLWFALLDPATVKLRVLGVAHGVTDDCQTSATALVCRRPDGSTALWPLPPS